MTLNLAEVVGGYAFSPSPRGSWADCHFTGRPPNPEHYLTRSYVPESCSDHPGEYRRANPFQVESMTRDCHINQCRPSLAQAGNAMGVVGGSSWSHIKGLCLCRVDSLVLCTAQQGDSYLSQLLTTAPSPNKHITSNVGGGGQQHSCQPPLVFYTAAAPAKSTVLRGILGMNRCSVGGVGPDLRPISGPVLSAGCVRAGEGFNGVLVSPGLSTGNYGGEKAIRQC
ncbi:hypothetical protein PAMP_023882 [Pampus punctatissimus]